MGSGLFSSFKPSQYLDILYFCLGKNIFNYEIYPLLTKTLQFFVHFNLTHTFLLSIALVLVLLSFQNMTNSNTILTVGIVFQYNTSRIVHLCLLHSMLICNNNNNNNIFPS